MDDSEREVSAREARAQFADLVSAAAAGLTIYITHRGKRVAMVAPLPDADHERWLLRTLDKVGGALDQIRVLVGEFDGAPEGRVVEAVRQQMSRDRVDIIALAETMLASRGLWVLSDMIETAAYTAYRLHRRGVQITLDGTPITNPTVADLDRTLHQRLDQLPPPEMRETP